MALSRRGMLARAAASFAGGVAVTVGGDRLAAAITADDPLPLSGGPAPATHADRRTPPAHHRVEVLWGVDTTQKLVALTFDDGPEPRWTADVLTVLAEEKAKATFFMVGSRVEKNAGLIRGRVDAHEIGNHTWDHLDLARRDFDEAIGDMKRAHTAIKRATGRETTLLRPPYGHMGGSTMLAAAEMGYDVVLWSLQMLESKYVDNPSGLVDYIVNKAVPGTVVLAHDVGADDRLVAIRQLPQMIRGLKAKGFEFVTVSELRQAATPVVGPRV